MRGISIGEEIRRKRLARGLTQEELAADICSVGYLSKIENGTRQPTDRTVRQLLEKLGLQGPFARSGEPSTEDYQYNVLRKEIIMAIEEWDSEALDEKLWIMSSLVDEADPQNAQFYQMARLIWQVMNGIKIDNYETQAYGLLARLRAGSTPWEILNRSDMSQTEMWILSNVAAGLMWKNRFDMAARAYMHIYSLIQNDNNWRKTMWRTKGIMCNNLAVCMIHMNRVAEAVRFCQSGMKCARHDGGYMLLLHLMRVDMEIRKIMQKTHEYYERQYLIREIYKAYNDVGASTKQLLNKPIDEVLWEHQIIMTI